jgi:hypothetical protein
MQGKPEEKIMKFTTKTRQAIIDGYLAQTGRNMFVPGEFVDWLADNPDHEAYEWFYGKDDTEAAREYRIGLARRMASGLRIVVHQEVSVGSVVHITTKEYPAFVSPIAGRRIGGGYVPFDPTDEGAAADLRKQAAVSLRAWLSRYRGAADDIDLRPIEEIVMLLSGSVAEAV